MRPLLFGSLLLSLLGCQEELGRPPVPRFTIAPPYVPADDAFHTRVTLDSTASADELDDPTAPLDVAWSFDDDRLRLIEGTRSAPTIVVASPGERPVTIVLTVTDPEGRSSSLSQRLGIVLPEE